MASLTASLAAAAALALVETESDSDSGLSGAELFAVAFVTACSAMTARVALVPGGAVDDEIAGGRTTG